MRSRVQNPESRVPEFSVSGQARRRPPGHSLTHPMPCLRDPDRLIMALGPHQGPSLDFGRTVNRLR